MNIIVFFFIITTTTNKNLTFHHVRLSPRFADFHVKKRENSFTQARSSSSSKEKISTIAKAQQ